MQFADLMVSSWRRRWVDDTQTNFHINADSKPYGLNKEDFEYEIKHKNNLLGFGKYTGDLEKILCWSNNWMAAGDKII